MKGRIYLANRILAMLKDTFFWSLLLCFMEIIFIKEMPAKLHYAYVFAVYLISYLTREYCLSNLGVLTIHAAVITGVMFLPLNMGMKTMLIIITGKAYCDSVQYIKRGNHIPYPAETPWPEFLFCFIVYIYGVYIPSTFLINAAYGYAILILIVHLLALYVVGIDKYIRSNNEAGDVPVDGLIKLNSPIVMGIIVLLLVCIALSTLLNTKEGADFIIGIMLQALKIIILGVTFYFKFLLLLFRFGNVRRSVEGFEEKVEGTVPEDTPDVLNIVMLFVFFIIAVFFLVKLAKKIILYLMEKRQPKTDTIEAIPDSHDMIKREKIRKTRFVLSADERARRIYKDRIERGRGIVSIKSDMTCRDIKRAFDENEAGDISEITDLYAEIRYGDTKVDGKIINEMNRLAKR